MNLVNLFKSIFFFQNFAAWFVSRIPCVIEHNLQKYFAIKKAFYLTAMEQLEGDYLEFGTFTGSSFVFATQIHRQLQALSKKPTRFYAFDSFSGFGAKETADEHPFYRDDIFKVDEKRVIDNIKRNSGKCEIRIVKGFYADSIQGKRPSEFGVEKSRVVFIDCDLKGSAQTALEFVGPTLQQGTILVVDDFYSYKGSSTLGVCGALEEFNSKNSHIQWRKVCDYGYGGVVLICSAC